MNDVPPERRAGKAPEGLPARQQTGAHLRILAERVPPPSRANDQIVVAMAIIAALGGLGFGVAFLLGAPPAAYGSALAVALLALGVAVRRFFTDRFADVEALEPRPPADDAAAPVAEVHALPRRGFLGRVIAAATGLVALGLAAPVASLGPLPHTAPQRPGWAAGRRVVTSDGTPVRPEDLAPGSVLTVWPEDAVAVELASVMLLRLSGGAPEPPTNLDWVVDDTVLAYSKVCTHAGCPVGLFRERDAALFCPCHQSTFDVRRGATPTFGPAARALPQLPLEVDADGYLVASDDFTDPVGPPVG
jgi:ubiquinol-cytochrome c reductase iron-sulfur subunit